MNHEAIEKLVELKEKGILSEEEFQMEKKKLLSPTNEVSENNISVQEIKTPQVVEQNNYKQNIVSQEAKAKDSPKKTVFIAMLIPIITIGIIWFFNREDSTSKSYSSYSPSTSSYNTTTGNAPSTTTNSTSTTTTSNSHTNAIASNDKQLPINNTKQTNKQTNKQTSKQATNQQHNNTLTEEEDLTEEEILEITWILVTGETAEKLWQYNKKQYWWQLLARAVLYFPTTKEWKQKLDINFKGKYSTLELAQLYLWHRIISEWKIDLKKDITTKTMKQVSDEALTITREYSNVNEDASDAFAMIAYGYAVLANEGKDLDKVFEKMFNEKIEPQNAKAIFDEFTKSRDVTRSENIPNNDPGY